MVGIVVLVCLALEIVIILFHNTDFAIATALVMVVQWIAALGFKAGDHDGASKFGGYFGVAAIIVCLLSLPSRDICMFLVVCAMNFVVSLLWGCSEPDSSSTPSATYNSASSGHKGNEIWEVKKVRRIGRTK